MLTEAELAPIRSGASAQARAFHDAGLVADPTVSRLLAHIDALTAALAQRPGDRDRWRESALQKQREIERLEMELVAERAECGRLTAHLESLKPTIAIARAAVAYVDEQVDPRGYHPGRIVGIALLPNSTSRGPSSVTLRIELDDGTTVLAQTTLRLLATAMRAFVARVPEEGL